MKLLQKIFHTVTYHLFDNRTPDEILNIEPLEVDPTIDEIEQRLIPKGWFVYQSGQSAAHFLWYVNMINFEDLVNDDVPDDQVRQIYVEEQDSFNDALDKVFEEYHERYCRSI